MNRLLGPLAVAALIATAQPPRLLADPADAAVAAAMKSHPIPGLVLEVIQDGHCVKRAAYGKANLEWDIATTPETVFEIGSMTKQFTAAGILLLAQEGKLSVDDRLSAHLRDTPPAWKDITLRHLLTHTSGLKNYTTLDGFELRQHLTREGFVKLLGAQPLDFQPGEKWAYCNSGFNLLGYVIETTSGTNYWKFLRERIWQPLGMTHTTNREPRDIVPFRASGYETDKNHRYINRAYDLTELFGAGAMISTADDLAKWNAALDAQTILNSESEKAMWTPVVLKDGQTHGYGFGWFLDTVRGHRNMGHGGQTSGFSAGIQRFPDDRLAVIVLTNCDEDGVANQVAKEVAAGYFLKKQ